MEAIHEQLTLMLVTKTVHQNPIKGNFVITKKRIYAQLKGRISKDFGYGIQRAHQILR